MERQTEQIAPLDLLRKATEFGRSIIMTNAKPTIASMRLVTILGLAILAGSLYRWDTLRISGNRVSFVQRDLWGMAAPQIRHDMQAAEVADFTIFPFVAGGRTGASTCYGIRMKLQDGSHIQLPTSLFRDNFETGAQQTANALTSHLQGGEFEKMRPWTIYGFSIIGAFFILVGAPSMIYLKQDD